MATVGERTRRKLSTVKPVLRDIVTEALEQAPPWLDFAVTYGTRTAEEQRALWLKGRNTLGEIVRPEEVVTHRDGVRKRSRHQPRDGETQGEAIDLVAYENGTVTFKETEVAMRAAYVIGYAAAKGIRLTGGTKWDWDYGHIEMA